ncbi:hypothetical protein BV22DRAFT_802645 [Leucogyrophana mollusca]|uniref:Uncharacterized protein n=1 Tax=Leucogyrophana mollusca TaxID=85980 RepID=A0ACB8B4U8_9AGAM|nr:hypothetical protein BV22DRAFT_802645 [Leucogyrophana mollusca]
MLADPPWWRTWSKIFLVLVSAASALGDYDIDDHNLALLSYSSTPGTNTSWLPYGVNGDVVDALSIKISGGSENGTVINADYSACYNSTFTLAQCGTDDNCELSIPFTGTGITIYVLQTGPIGVSVSAVVDGGQPTTHTLSGPTGPNYQSTNMTLFDVQSLASGSHTLSLTVLDFDGPYGTQSWLGFDYAHIREADPPPSTSTSPQSAPSPPTTISSISSSSSTAPAQVVPNPATNTATIAIITTVASFISPSRSPTPGDSSTPSGSSTGGSPSVSDVRPSLNLAAIVGGACGGAAIIAAAIVVLLCRRRRRRRRMNEMRATPFQATREDADPIPPASLPSGLRTTTSMSPLMGERGHSSVLDLRPPSEAEPSALLLSRPAAARVSMVGTVLSDLGSSAPRSRVSDRKSALALAFAEADEQAPERTTPSSGSADTSPQPPPTASLTSEQADFVHRLYTNNVPASIVARVIERMVADPSVRFQDSTLGSGGTIGSAPPSYEYAAR